MGFLQLPILLSLYDNLIKFCISFIILILENIQKYISFLTVISSFEKTKETLCF